MNRIERLRAAIENPKALQREREETWEEIKTKAPELAEFLKAVQPRLGKVRLENFRVKQC